VISGFEEIVKIQKFKIYLSDGNIPANISKYDGIMEEK
jgi:hypothetical protein